jgi:rhodanese-related sulfurtransferase
VEKLFDLTKPSSSRSMLRQALIIAALALAPAIGQAIYFHDRVSWHSPVPASEMVSLDQARAWGANAIWIDARPDADYVRDHVPGAILLNEDRWNELLPGLLTVWSPDKKLVVYCSSQSCNASREVARRLRDEAQLKNVFVLEDGWEAWLRKK